MPYRHRRLLGITASLFGLITVPLAADAAELNALVFYDAEYTTNSARAPNNEVGEWILQPGARLGASHEGPSIELDADYDLRRRMYQEDVYDDESVATGTASLDWEAVTDRLSFHAANSRTESTIDSRGQFQPDNRQVTDTSTIGTEIQIPWISNHYIELGYDYSLASYDETDSDNQRHIGTLSYVVPLSTVSRIQLNGQYSDVRFDNSLSPDYTSQSGHAQYVSSSDRLDIDVAVGYTLFDRELQRDDVEGVTGSGSLTWRVSGATSARISYSHSIDDESTDTVQGIPDFDEEFDENSGLNEAFVSDMASALITTQVGRNTFSVSPYYRQQDYEDIPRDEETTGVSLVWDRKLRPTVSASLYANVSRTEFSQVDQDDDDLHTGLRVDFKRWRRLALSFAVTYSETDSDIDTSNYEEWNGTVSVSYTLL